MDAYRKELHVREQGGFDPGRIVSVLRHHDAERCLVMPRADRSLDQAIRAERFAGHDLPQVVSIARDLALALQEMHRRGFVHADVKVGAPPLPRLLTARDTFHCDLLPLVPPFRPATPAPTQPVVPASRPVPSPGTSCA